MLINVCMYSVRTWCTQHITIASSVQHPQCLTLCMYSQLSAQTVAGSYCHASACMCTCGQRFSNVE